LDPLCATCAVPYIAEKITPEPTAEIENSIHKVRFLDFRFKECRVILEHVPNVLREANHNQHYGFVWLFTQHIVVGLEGCGDRIVIENAPVRELFNELSDVVVLSSLLFGKNSLVGAELDLRPPKICVEHIYGGDALVVACGGNRC